jgi:hypothetical protein
MGSGSCGRFDFRIGVMDADGGIVRCLTPCRAPAVSPWLMNADGSGKRRLTKSKFYETNPVVSPTAAT